MKNYSYLLNFFYLIALFRLEFIVLLVMNMLFKLRAKLSKWELLEFTGLILFFSVYNMIALQGRSIDLAAFSMLKGQVFWFLFVVFLWLYDRGAFRREGQEGLSDRAVFMLLLGVIVLWFVAGGQSHELAMFSSLVASYLIIVRPRLTVFLILLGALLTFFHLVSENRTALMLLVIASGLRIGRPWALIPAMTLFTLLFWSEIEAIDFRFQIIGTLINFPLMWALAEPLLIGIWSPVIDETSPIMELYSFNENIFFLRSATGDLTLTSLHNQWLHLLFQYGIFFLVYVFFRIARFVRMFALNSSHVFSLSLIIVLSGFANSIVLSETFLLVAFFWGLIRNA